MMLARHLWLSAVTSRTTLFSCGIVWAIAFGIPPILPEESGNVLSSSSQVFCSTYFLTVVATSLALQTALGRKCAGLKPLLHTPVARLRILGECAGAVVGVALTLALATALVSQVAPWYRGKLDASVESLACGAVCASWLALATLALNLWLEPELGLPLALTLLFALMYHPGAVPVLPDPWWPESMRTGEFSPVLFALRVPLLLLIPLGVAAAGLRSS